MRQIMCGGGTSVPESDSGVGVKRVQTTKKHKASPPAFTTPLTSPLPADVGEQQLRLERCIKRSLLK